LGQTSTPGATRPRCQHRAEPSRHGRHGTYTLILFARLCSQKLSPSDLIETTAQSTQSISRVCIEETVVGLPPHPSRPPIRVPWRESTKPYVHDRAPCSSSVVTTRNFLKSVGGYPTVPHTTRQRNRAAMVIVSRLELEGLVGASRVAALGGLELRAGVGRGRDADCSRLGGPWRGVAWVGRTWGGGSLMGGPCGRRAGRYVGGMGAWMARRRATLACGASGLYVEGPGGGTCGGASGGACWGGDRVGLRGRVARLVTGLGVSRGGA
jgi:hypothetical protein